MNERRSRRTSLPALRKNPPASFVLLSLRDCTDPELHMIDAEMEIGYKSGESRGGKKDNNPAESKIIAIIQGI
jgi:hypothetical protein